MQLNNTLHCKTVQLDVNLAVVPSSMHTSNVPRKEGSISFSARNQPRKENNEIYIQFRGIILARNP